MAGRDEDRDFLAETARRQVRQQRAAHARLREARIHRGTALVDHAGRTLTAIANRVVLSEQRFSGAGSAVERDSALETLRLMNTFLSHMQEASEWIEAARAEHLHPGQLYFIDEAAEAVVGRPCDVVVVPNGRYRYATLSWPFDWILKRLNLQVGAGTRPIVIFFSPQERGTLLLIPLFAHELGHSAVLEHGLVDRLLASHFGSPAFDKAFDDAADNWSQQHGANNPTARIVVERHLRKWTTELMCDSIAVQYFGFAYLLAFAAVVASESADEVQETHPPTVLRLRAMLKALSEGSDNWLDLGRANAPNTVGWIEEFAAKSVRTTAPFEDFLIDTMDQWWSEIHADMAARVGTERYTPSEYLPVAEQLQSLLRARVLPAQLEDGTPAPRRAIVTAAWFHVLDAVKMGAAEGDAARSLPLGLENLEFQTFLEKAVEMSRVLQEWRKA